MKKFWKIAAIVCGAVLFVVIALQTVLNRPFVSRTIDKYAAEHIDGELQYSSLRFSTFKCFPNAKKLGRTEKEKQG